MTHRFVTATLVTLVALTATSLWAQGRGGAGFMRGLGGGDPLMLLAFEPVQKELGLNKETLAKVQKISDSIREGIEAAPVGQAFQELSDEQHRELMTKMQETARKVQGKYQPQLKEALTAEQFKRLQQIAWQVAGSGALADPEVVKTLKISDEQQEKIKTLTNDYQQKQRALMQQAFDQRAPLLALRDRSGPGADVFPKMQELNKERDTKALDVLSAGQREQFTELKGKAFDLTQLQGGFGGRGGPGGRRGAPGKAN